MKTILSLDVIIHLIAWFPLACMLKDNFFNLLTFNPIQVAIQRTGQSALIFLLLSLGCTPLTYLLSIKSLLRLRRSLGLYSFIYAAIHLFIYIGIDYAYHWGLIKQSIIEKPYIIVGLIAFTILLLLAITSFDWWRKKLGNVWNNLHRMVYLGCGLAILHYSWVKKGSLFTLQGDILLPSIATLVFLFFLVFRIPIVRHWVRFR